MSRPPALGTRDLYFTTECSVNAIIAAETAKSQTCNARRGHCARCWLLSWRAPVSTSVHCAGPALQTASRCRDQAPCMRPGHRRRGQTLRRSLASGTAGAWEGACCPGPPPPSFCELRRLACKAVSLPSPSHDTMPLNSGNQVAATTDPARPLTPPGWACAAERFDREARAAQGELSTREPNPSPMYGSHRSVMTPCASVSAICTACLMCCPCQHGIPQRSMCSQAASVTTTRTALWQHSFETAPR